MPTFFLDLTLCLNYNNSMLKIRENLDKITILDKYILKQIIEMFLMGVCVFTSIIFASDTFITLIKQISLFGIPFKVALMIILL